eukprot:gb/GECG01012157.1/.p1 GENE.gb/GECG01012157.1/~~gb/GECG01012157.1/.p1  ORF type:complete len:195 (+),score=33.31 gb/GECG01012157.1/:1-585(+)
MSDENQPPAAVTAPAPARNRQKKRPRPKGCSLCNRPTLPGEYFAMTMPPDPPCAYKYRVKNEKKYTGDNQTQWRPLHARFVQLVCVDYREAFEQIPAEDMEEADTDNLMDTEKAKELFKDIARKLADEGYGELKDGTTLTTDLLMRRWETIVEDETLMLHRQLKCGYNCVEEADSVAWLPESLKDALFSRAQVL